MFSAAITGLTGRLARGLRDVRTFPGDALAAWRREGLRGVWRELRVRPLGRIFMGGSLLVMERDLSDGLETPPPPGVSIERLAANWEVLTAIAGSRRCARFHEAAAHGRVCFVARREGRPIGYAWLAERMEPELDSLVLALPPGTARLSDLYVVPPERNAGVGSALVSARLSYAREHGFVKTWQTVAPGNHASRRVIEKTGCVPARVVAEVRILPLLRWQRLRLLPAEASEAPRHQPGAEPTHLPGPSD